MRTILIFLIALILNACITTGTKDVEEFIVSLDSPQFQIGEIELQFDNIFPLGGIRSNTVTVLYFPREDAVCLQYRLDYITYHQFWSRSGRQVFINALESYKGDYQDRNLERNSRASKRNYGTVQGYLIWQMFSISVQAKANMNVDLGYFFNDRSPYFTVTQREAVYEDQRSRTYNRTSNVISMYFTRAQADELAALFQQHYLRGLTVPGGSRIETVENTVDTYED
jgi:hypothetical protein